MKKEVEQFAVKEKAIQSQKQQVSAFILSVDLHQSRKTRRPLVTDDRALYIRMCSN